MAVHETTKLKKEEYLKAMPNHLCIAAKKNEFIYYTINYSQPPSAGDSREFVTETNNEDTSQRPNLLLAQQPLQYLHLCAPWNNSV